LPPCENSWRQKKKTQPPTALDLLDDEPPGLHGYGVNMICLCLRMVLGGGCSLRGVERVLMVVTQAFGLPLDIPDWTTSRLWLMRLGHYELTRPLEKADDWAWLADHSVQIGTEKVLVIVGIRLQDLPERGDCLRHQDLHLIALVPSESWTQPDVDRVLQETTQRTGVPRVIVNDYGSDLHGGVQLFQQRHEQTAEIYDIKHKAACLLKHRLERDPRWQEFQTKVGQTRCAVQQTELAFASPPAPKIKARSMNLEPQLAWGEEVLNLLEKPPACVQEWTTSERLHQKLGWLQQFAEVLAEWSEWQQVVNIAIEFVNGQGIWRGMGHALRQELPRTFKHQSSRTLAKELIRFVATQARQAKKGERLVGSTEVLESCFGTMKQLEKQQARSGFTSLVLSFGALVAETTPEAINAAMQHSGTKEVQQWCKEKLGTTLFAQRKIAFAESATKSG
jgi:hypothetical protein